jgi:hypothetical protein
MELVKLDPNTKLRDIPQENLDEIFQKKFKYWISNLLAISADKEEGVNNAIEAIKYHGIGFSIRGIQKVFEMYANGALNTQPISNHIDYILVGKIFNDYKKQRTKPKQKVMIQEKQYSEQEKENILFTGVVNCFDKFYQYGLIDDGYLWVHDHLMGKNLFTFTHQQKASLWEKAKKNILRKSKSEDYQHYKTLVAQMERKKNNKAEVEYKYLRISEYFMKLIAEKKHIKDFI